MRFIVGFFWLSMVIGAPAQADPYRMWSDEVSKATKGLGICAEAYSDAIGHGRTNAEIAKRLPEARQTCGVMKIGFDTTMLTVRKHVNGIDGVLSSYHKLGNEAFKKLIPKPNQDPLEYYATSLELVLMVNQEHYKIVALNGGW